MVRLYGVWTLLIFLMTPLLVQALPEVNVSAEINQQEAFENVPLKGTITITHNKQSAVDLSTFKIDNKGFDVEFVRQVPMSPNSTLVISIYNFEMPGMPAGLHLVPQISVKIGGELYKSIPAGFEVKAGSPVSAPPPKPSRPSSRTSSPSISRSQSSSKVVLHLEGFYQGKQTLYPGQRGWVGYKYLYNTPITLTEEDLPLLEAKGFKKIGGKSVEDRREGKYDVREIKQQVEAVKPGKYTFGPSVIVGFPYQLDRSGRKKVSKERITAQAEAVTVTVVPFPDKKKPESFTGATGQYKMRVVMLTPPEVRVGDKVTLSISIEGTGDLSTVQSPELCCQPGFSGIFRASDIPPVGKIHRQTKQFIVDIRPLTDSIKAVPPVEFTYYDPNSGKYVTIKSDPIALKVNPLPEGEEPIVPLIEPKTVEKEKKKTKVGVPAIEIEGNYALGSSDLRNIPFGNWWSLILIPIGLGVIYLQYDLRRISRKFKKDVPKETAERVFKVVMEGDKYDSEFFFMLNRSFFLLLKEKGLIRDIDITPYKLPAEDPTKEVRDFLVDIEKRRFGVAGTGFTASDKKKAKAMFEKIQNQDFSS